MAAPATTAEGSEALMTEDSTQGTPGMISGLEVPQPSFESEVATHGTQINDVDPYLRTQFVIDSTILWTDQMSPGTVLYSRPIHPSSLNDVVKYMTRPYNYWKGSMEFKMFLAGTGFNAGKIGIFKLPPNKRPEEIGGINEWSMLPYEVMDVKQMMAFTRVGSDQANILYHYNPLDLNDSSTFGGYFVIVVLMKLVGRQTGDSINLMVSNRLAEDFVVGQLLPPSLFPGASAGVSPYNLCFPQPGDQVLHPLSADPIVYMKILPAAPLVKNTGTYGAYSLAGQQVSPALTKDRSDPLKMRAWALKQPSGLRFERNAPHEGEQYWMIDRTKGQTPENVISIPYKTPTDAASLVYQADLHTWVALEGEANMMISPTEVANVPYIIPQVSSLIPIPDEHVKFAIYNGESQVVFTNRFGTTGRSDVWQTRATGEVLSQLAPTYGPNDCVLFQVYEIDTGLPVMQLKLYPEGFFTTAHSSTTLLMEYKRYKVEFIGSVNRTQPIPSQYIAASKMNLRGLIATKEIKSYSERQLNREIENLRLGRGE